MAKAEPISPGRLIGVRKTTMHTSMMITRRSVLPIACVTGCTFFKAFIATCASMIWRAITADHTRGLHRNLLS